MCIHGLGKESLLFLGPIQQNGVSHKLVVALVSREQNLEALSTSATKIDAQAIADNLHAHSFLIVLRGFTLNLLRSPQVESKEGKHQSNRSFSKFHDITRSYQYK